MPTFDCNTSKWDGTKPPGYNPDQYCNRFPYYTPELIDIRAGFRDSIDPMMQAQMGLCGTPEYLTTGNSSTAGKYFCMIEILTDTILDVAAGGTNEIDGTGSDITLTNLGGVTLKTGLFLYGNFKKVKLVSGLVKCYPHPFK